MHVAMLALRRKVVLDAETCLRAQLTYCNDTEGRIAVYSHLALECGSCCGRVRPVAAAAAGSACACAMVKPVSSQSNPDPTCSHTG